MKRVTSSKFCRICTATAAGFLCFFLFDACAMLAQDSNRQDLGEQTGLQYSNERLPPNAILLGLYSFATYDDNILNSNQNRAGASLLEGGGLLRFRVSRPRGNMFLDYRPTFELYRQFQGYDLFNQATEFTGTYKLTPHLILNAKDSFSYQRWTLQQSSNGNTAYAPVVPGGLNANVLVPLIRELTNEAQLGANLLLSRRSSFEVFGTHSLREFEDHQTTLGNLVNTQGYGGGAGYRYRTSQTTTLGLRYVYQDLRFGQTSRAVVHSGYLTLSSNLGEPNVSFELFIGPQFASSRDTSLSTSTANPPPTPTTPPTPVSTFRRDVGGGANFTVRSRKMVVRIFLLRQLTDGAGLVALVSNTSEGLEIRRRLWHGLDAVLSGGNGQSTSFSDVFGRGNIRSQNGGIALECPLGYGFLFHAGYTYLRQRTSGNLPLAFDVDRNRVAVGFFYQPRPHPLGRR